MTLIFLGLGAVAIFIWSKLSPKTKVSTTEVKGDQDIDIAEKFKEGAKKVVAIVGGVAGAGGAVTAASGLVGGSAAPVVARLQALRCRGYF